MEAFVIIAAAIIGITMLYVDTRINGRLDD